MNRPLSPEIATYKAIRAAAKSWFPKVMRLPADKRFDIVKAARKLGLPVDGRTLMFDGDGDIAVLTDYHLLDFRPEGKSLAESCLFALGELTALEADWHRAFLASRTSLFAVTHVHSDEPKILLRDCLDKKAPELWLTDLGLSDTVRRFGSKLVMFTRVISLHGLNMTGGYSFIFEPKHEFALVDGYRRAMWSVPSAKHDQRRTAYFLDLHRKFGVEQVYTDVVPSPGSDRTA